VPAHSNSNTLLRVHCLNSDTTAVFHQQSPCLHRSSSSNQLAQPSPAERELVRYSRHERPTDRQPCPSAHCPPATLLHCAQDQTARLDTAANTINRPVRALTPLTRRSSTRYSIVKPCEPSPLAPTPLRRVRPPVTSYTQQTRPADAKLTFTRRPLHALDSRQPARAADQMS
jgi:hypothetical protein